MAESQHRAVERSVLLLGHSYVHRLADFVRASQNPQVEHDFGLNSHFLDKFNVSFHGIGGARVATIHSDVHTILAQYSAYYDVVVLQLGGNDINRNSNAELIAHDIVNLAVDINATGRVNQVVVSQLFFREKPRCDVYNAVAYDVNGHLVRTLGKASYRKQGMSFWKHRGFSRPEFTTSHRDGVHLNADGQWKFYQSVKSAFIQGVKRADLVHYY